MTKQLDYLSYYNKTKSFNVDESKISPSTLVIMLHGYGANGKDLINLATFFDDKVLDNTYFISPNAPHKLTGNEAMFIDDGYKWFDFITVEENALYSQVKELLPMIDEFIEEKLKQFNLSSDNLILVGFSQGAMMVTHYSIFRNKAPKITISFAGGLVTKNIADKIKSSSSILFIHGDSDMLVPPSISIDSANLLKSLNVDAEYVIIEDLEHSINDEAIDVANKFLSEKITR